MQILSRSMLNNDDMCIGLQKRLVSYATAHQSKNPTIAQNHVQKPFKLIVRSYSRLRKDMLHSRTVESDYSLKNKAARMWSSEIFLYLDRWIVVDQFNASWRNGTAIPPVKHVFKIIATKVSVDNYEAYRYIVSYRHGSSYANYWTSHKKSNN